MRNQRSVLYLSKSPLDHQWPPDVAYTVTDADQVMLERRSWSSADHAPWPKPVPSRAMRYTRKDADWSRRIEGF